MRTAILHLAFIGLEARRAETGAYEGNVASLGVTAAARLRTQRRRRVRARCGEPQVEKKFKMDRAAFERIRRDDITIENLEPCLAMFGIGG